MNDYQAQQAARASAAQALQAAFPYLVAVGTERGKNDGLNAAAKNIRIELKRAFPKVKFSVKSSRFSGGDSISIRWTDGPTTAQVDEIADRYQAGTFDGMTDSYNYERNAWRDAFGDAKYLSTSRSYSDAAVASVIRTLRAKYAGSIERIELAQAVTVEAYNKALLRGVPMFQGSMHYDDVERHISLELQRRTWALNQAPKAVAPADEATEVLA